VCRYSREIYDRNRRADGNRTDRVSARSSNRIAPAASAPVATGVRRRRSATLNRDEADESAP